MNLLRLNHLPDIASCGADTIIDVRSPAEFAQDHIPGAINLPVLSDAERAKVGTIYKQDSSFMARKIGAALVAQNAARHLMGPLADKPGGWQPLVYCWRGGQRSGSFATILDQIGWRVQLLQGGYRSYRRLVVDKMYDTPLPHKLTLIEGGTGTAKTRLLHHLAQAGAQVIDLEGLANHRGSLFGARDGGQPSQKMFETRLAAQLENMDPTRMTWIEAESSKIGARVVPSALWHAMRDAPRIEVQAPIAARARFLATAYADLTNNSGRLHDQIDMLRPYHAADVIAAWHALADEGAWEELAAGLMQAHYDPRYAKSMARSVTADQVIALDDLDESTLAQAAQDLARRVT
ncbi:tRNA 2-selenouridine(34) synthase MnmH [Sulfitobacter sp. CW3]|uniref:tRNA 2-selenouridine(34) synthase MnmH n=1 Tax=Sulfitobacter sp. CW3 TaxID=2861965 RepID=UPI001C5FD883|nr:tRNA 2-selenouridine(34) synthase MnmH [Sulfitobacter sp. CW3]MBW4963524.1 tRNA 2-selenouridine(34) synthase MnmH [Sulfitobacter sp. CW3]